MAAELGGTEASVNMYPHKHTHAKIIHTHTTDTNPNTETYRETYTDVPHKHECTHTYITHILSLLENTQPLVTLSGTEKNILKSYSTGCPLAFWIVF